MQHSLIFPLRREKWRKTIFASLEPPPQKNPTSLYKWRKNRSFTSFEPGSVRGKYRISPVSGEMSECCATIQKYDWVSNDATFNANAWSVPLSWSLFLMVIMVHETTGKIFYQGEVCVYCSVFSWGPPHVQNPDTANLPSVHRIARGDRHVWKWKYFILRLYIVINMTWYYYYYYTAQQRWTWEVRFIFSHTDSPGRAIYCKVKIPRCRPTLGTTTGKQELKKDPTGLLIIGNH